MKVDLFPPEQMFCMILIFCRISSSFFMVPIFGEKTIPTITRLALAILITISVFFSVNPGVILPATTIEVSILLVCEIIFGLFIGLLCRIIISSIHTAGMSIGSSIGISAAVMFDISQGDQSSLVGNLMNMIVISLLLSMDFHILFIQCISQSYQHMPIGMLFKYDINIVEVLIESVSMAWITALQLSAPFIISSLIMFVGAGILSRLMPQMQIFFLMLPLQMIVGFLILML